MGVPGVLAFAFSCGRVCLVRTVCFLSSPRLFGDFFVIILSFGSLSTCLAIPAWPPVNSLNLLTTLRRFHHRPEQPYSQQRLPHVTGHFRRLFRRLFPSFHGLFLSRYLYNGGSLAGDAHSSNQGGHSGSSSHLEHCLGGIPSRRPCLSQLQFPRPRTACSEFRNLRPSYGSFRPWLWLSSPVSCLLVY